MNADTVLIFGGSRETGLEVAKLLTARGEKVAAFARPTSDLTQLQALPLQQIIYGDVCDPVSVGKAFAAGWYKAVVCTIGATRGQVPRPDFTGVKHIVDSIGKLSRCIPRVILVTAIGAGDSRAAVAPKVLEVLGEVLRLKTEAEDYLKASGLDWVILRPGGMTDDPASGTAVKTEDHMKMGVIHRADLARIVVDCLDDPATNGRIFHTVDPAITWQAPLQRGEDLRRG
ncbi:MAG: SDR family oxidoreductase [Gammaproteobacteria bacterium]|nr:SDR family oxidoreductase [Gammaproteobacteria bacterium]